MNEFIFDWDSLDQVRGNTRHVLDAGVDPRDVEEVILSLDAERKVAKSSTFSTHRRYIVWGQNAHGEVIAVVYERGIENPCLIRPVTAWVQDEGGK